MSSNGNGLANGTNGKNGKKRRRRIIWGSVALVVLLGGGYGVKAALSPNHEIDPSKLADVERGDLARVVVATGKIQPLSKAEIKSKASGIVKKIYVDYGDRVKSGQILAELDKIQLEAALRAAEANLQAAKAACDSAKATLERNKVDAEGPDVPFLKLNMDRAQQMFKDGVMSKSLVEDAEKNYQLALNKQVSAQRNLAVSQAEIAKAEAQVAQAKASADNAQEDLAQLHHRQPDRRPRSFARRQRRRRRQLHPYPRLASHTYHDARRRQRSLRARQSRRVRYRQGLSQSSRAHRR